MVPYIGEVLFDEPQGRSVALVHFGSSLVFSCMFVYGWSVSDAGEFLWLLFFVVGTALAGIAESLPRSRRQAAGVLRSGGILVLLGLFAAYFAGFDSIVGW